MRIRSIIFIISLLTISVSSLANKAGEDTLHILFTGDVLLDRGVRLQIDHYGFDRIMKGVDSLFHSKDAVMINLECPLTSTSHPVSKQIVFRADTTMASALRRHGVTHAALANNHTIDQGFSGLEETASCLRNSGIITVGYGENYSQQIAPTIISKGDVKVAIFNDNAVLLENWSRTSPDKPNILNISIDSLCTEMKRFHQSNPDVFMVAFLHWGFEFQPLPSMQQKIDAIKLANSGVSAIIGQHSHVIQPMKMTGKVPVFYSLGNFIFDQHRKNTDQGIAAELIFTSSGLISSDSHLIYINRCRPEVIDTKE